MFRSTHLVTNEIKGRNQAIVLRWCRNERILYHLKFAKLFMEFSVMYIICGVPKLDAWRSQIVTPASCQYDSIRQHKHLL
jgi:hypothetical protein